MEHHVARADIEARHEHLGLLLNELACRARVLAILQSVNRCLHKVLCDGVLVDPEEQKPDSKDTQRLIHGKPHTFVEKSADHGKRS